MRQSQSQGGEREEGREEEEGGEDEDDEEEDMTINTKLVLAEMSTWFDEDETDETDEKDAAVVGKW